MIARISHYLPPGQAMTITAPAQNSVTYTPVPARTPITTVSASGSATLGPAATGSYYELEYDGVAPTVAFAPVDYPTLAEAVAAAMAAMGWPTAGLGDVRFYSGAGAPVDYTDGTPPATGEGEAGIGSLYVNITNGKHYVNGGTKAQPIWKLVTSAS